MLAAMRRQAETIGQRGPYYMLCGPVAWDMVKQLEARHLKDVRVQRDVKGWVSQRGVLFVPDAGQDFGVDA